MYCFLQSITIHHFVQSINMQCFLQSISPSATAVMGGRAFNQKLIRSRSSGISKVSWCPSFAFDSAFQNEFRLQREPWASRCERKLPWRRWWCCYGDYDDNDVVVGTMMIMMLLWGLWWWWCCQGEYDDNDVAKERKCIVTSPWRRWWYWWCYANEVEWGHPEQRRVFVVFFVSIWLVRTNACE